MSHSPTILIADDEEAPREQLRFALGRLWPRAQIVAVCHHGVDAWDSFLEHEPQACFLDIRMPGMSGIEVAQRIHATQIPSAVVFCTAFNTEAVNAFEAGAIDYLLKPLDETRLAQSVARVQAKIDAQMPPRNEWPPNLLALLSQAQNVTQKLRTLQASVGKEVRLIQVADVIYFESDTRYTRVVYRQDGVDAEALIRTPLKELIGALESQDFWQIHRSTIVNSRQLASAVRVDEGNMHVTLRGRRETLPVSRQFQNLFRGQ